jgi:hypothetical protein
MLISKNALKNAKETTKFITPILKFAIVAMVSKEI